MENIQNENNLEKQNIEENPSEVLADKDECK